MRFEQIQFPGGESADIFTLGFGGHTRKLLAVLLCNITKQPDFLALGHGEQGGNHHHEAQHEDQDREHEQDRHECGPFEALLDGVGLISGDVQAAWAGSDACVPAVDGERVLSDSRTTLAGVTLVDAPDPVGTLAEVTASQTRTRTALVDDADGSDVLATATTTVGDIDLIGGAVTVDVTNPVVLQARSDGTNGSAGFVSPPTITATVGGNEIDIPLNAAPQSPDSLCSPLADPDSPTASAC